MQKKLFIRFSGLPMTIAAGIFLAASFVFMLCEIDAPIDPAWITIIICGYPLVYLAVTRLIHNQGMRKISSALLISIAMFACIWLSFTPDGHENLFAAGEVAFIMAIGGILEDKTVERAKRGINQLMRLAPQQGRRINGDEEEMVPIEAVVEGDILRVLPGETIPVDAEIVRGNSSVDQSIMTGESLPVDKAPGDQVYCGTINRFGAIEIRATKVGQDSSLQKLIRMVEEAENNKAPMQRIVDQWASWLVPAALLIAIVTYLITWDVIRAVTILVVFCPCALALATPTSIMAAIGQATKRRVIIKSGDALERMGNVHCIAFDKTGTLTYGTLTVSDIRSFDPALDERALLTLAASAESLSEHPLGKAVVEKAKLAKIELFPVDDFVMAPGKGISATVNGKRLFCGNNAWLLEHNIALDAQRSAALETFRKQGKAVIMLASANRCIGILALSDTLRASAKPMVQKLTEMKTPTALLTGDHRQTAEYFAKQVGISQIYAELLPGQKVERIKRMQTNGQNVCMIGDGVNDAPALKAAHVGVAMGSMGSDIAVEAADIALMGDDLSQVPYLKQLSLATVRHIKVNITLSMLINLVAIILSVLAWLNPITGALVHNVGSVLVVLNAARLYDKKFP